MDEKAAKSKERWGEATSHSLRNDYVKEAECYEDALKIDERNVLAYIDLARLYVTKLHNIEQAEEYCRRGYAVANIPKEITAAPAWLNDIHEEIRTELDFWMMHIRLAQGRVDEARPYLENIKNYFEKYSKGHYLNAKEVFEEHVAKKDVTPKGASKSGCFIASAGCGDPSAPAVIALSAFRDAILAASPIGRMFVRFYYALSPSIAEVIARSAALRAAAMTLIVRPAIWALRLYGTVDGKRKTVAS